MLESVLTVPPMPSLSAFSFARKKAREREKASSQMTVGKRVLKKGRWLVDSQVKGGPTRTRSP